MNKKEMAILTGLAALAGCRNATEAEMRVTRERGPEVTMQVMGNFEKAFKQGLDPNAKLPLKELPAVMQKNKGRSH